MTDRARPFDIYRISPSLLSLILFETEGPSALGSGLFVSKEAFGYEIHKEEIMIYCLNIDLLDETKYFQ